LLLDLTSTPLDLLRTALVQGSAARENGRLKTEVRARRKRRPRRLNHLIWLISLLLAALLALLGRWNAPSPRLERRFSADRPGEPFVVRPARDARPARRVYPYSVIPGGVYSKAELQAALDSDAIVTRHYASFRWASARPVELTAGRRAYVSYRMGDSIYWTRRPVRLAKGEMLLSDGESAVRARCGNRISQTPRQPTNPAEPSQVETESAEADESPLPETQSQPYADLAYPASALVAEVFPPADLLGVMKSLDTASSSMAGMAGLAPVVGSAAPLPPRSTSPAPSPVPPEVAPILMPPFSGAGQRPGSGPPAPTTSIPAWPISPTLSTAPPPTGQGVSPVPPVTTPRAGPPSESGPPSEPASPPPPGAGPILLLEPAPPATTTRTPGRPDGPPNSPPPLPPLGGPPDTSASATPEPSTLVLVALLLPGLLAMRPRR